jgi:2-methylcitrate dehydratase PrpD
LRGAGDVTEIVAHCHPLVVELMGRLQPADGLQARFSAAHTITAGLLDGELTLRQFSDARVRAEDIRRLRSLIRFAPRQDLARDEASVEIRFADGATETEHVAHARGSLARPLSDDELAAKARSLIEPVLPGRTDDIIAATTLDGPSLDALITAMTPGNAETQRSTSD